MSTVQFLNNRFNGIKESMKIVSYIKASLKELTALTVSLLKNKKYKESVIDNTFENITDNLNILQSCRRQIEFYKNNIKLRL
ncbi:MAG: hypothetical protein SNJ71_05570 [Bacteroidales bacterium]